MLKSTKFKGKKILFMLSGSIACYKACEVISTLMKEGAIVQTVVTQSALKFIGKATLEGLTKNKVFEDAFSDGDQMSHIDLVKEYDLIVLAPASANTINKMAAGICDNLVTQIFMANNFIKPFYIFPAMNSEMYKHPATQESLNKLELWGSKLMKTGVGLLACGDTGEGRLLEPSQILSILEDGV